MSLATPNTSAAPPVAADHPANGADLLRQMGRMGLFKPGVPVALGGDGGQHGDLYANAETARAIAALGPYAPQVFKAQRLTIEALLQSQNVALREFIVPELVLAHRASAAVIGGSALIGQLVGNGWQLNGRFNGVANLVWSGFSLVVPAQLEDNSPGWLMLRSEEDGLYTTPGEDKAAWRGATMGVVTLKQVFFRRDEWLGTDAITTHLHAAAAELDRWFAAAQELPQHP
ncbi:hypothetical protein [Macromonas nakdongensis]|uniref:hypothetical protein n=1 Tax=Macromonas nakdongensis TaxID=1843082 RepID=UPI0012FE9B01|nr:hypothetical protein [Macromonas nakdongensis]